MVVKIAGPDWCLDGAMVHQAGERSLRLSGVTEHRRDGFTRLEAIDSDLDGCMKWDATDAEPGKRIRVHRMYVLTENRHPCWVEVWH